MRCLSCGEEIALGRRVFMIPFEDYGEDAYLFAHYDCMPELKGKEGILDGYFVEGSEPIFVLSEVVDPRQLVEVLEGAKEGD